MNLGELLRTYAPHIWQAHLEWAGEDVDPTALPDIDDDVTGRRLTEYADAFTDILSPAEQEFVRTTPEPSERNKAIWAAVEALSRGR